LRIAKIESRILTLHFCNLEASSLRDPMAFVIDGARNLFVNTTYADKQQLITE